MKDTTKKIIIYDTTLRDGTQAEGISFSCQDKLAIAIKLDDLGVDYIEGGFPLSNPKDQEFFKEIRNTPLKTSKIAAFGSTRKANTTAEKDVGIKALLSAETPVVTIVGKSWDFHVKEVLRTTLDENLRMIESSVGYLKSMDREVVFDAEHFFDGYKANPKFATKVIAAAVNSGADAIVLCDTNGGCLPMEIGDIIKAIKGKVKVTFGIHTHNDSDAAVANTLVAVGHGIRHVQGTINGIGERCGNADLCSIIPNLILKAGFRCVKGDGLKKITEISRYVYETANVIPRQNQPFVGKSAFTHKGGLHAHAIKKNKKTYEHIEPEIVGNERRILISELSGGASILAKVEKYSLSKDRKLMQSILKQVQDMENDGYQFESAEGSFVLLVKKAIGKHKTFFDLIEFRVIVEKDKKGVLVSEAIVKIKIKKNNCVEFTVGEGDGPVDALDSALRKALTNYYPSLADMRLVDYKVRVINPRGGTAAKVRVIIESCDTEETWGTVGVSENLIDASWQALVDSIEYKLQKD
ncbi:MAG: citramalate synthase [Candidatus Anammoxibacter sp.]